VHVVTRNQGKLREIRAIVGRYGIDVVAVAADKVEIQSDSLEDIVRHAARALLGSVPEPFAVEDSGLFIEALNGFPGPYSSYVYRTIGCAGVLKLMDGVPNRRARFVCAAALGLGGEVRVFRGEVEGEVSTEARGSSGFGFDPIFIPRGYSRTFAEMSLEEKCLISHRAKAFSLLAEYLAAKLQ